MRSVPLILALAFVFCSLVSGRMDLGARSTYASIPAAGVTSSMVAANHKEVSASPNSPAPVDFATQVKPIFEKKCQPCHFSGGQVYQKMPFDRPETIKTLGTKLFTRIKDENDRRVISDFLAQ